MAKILLIPLIVLVLGGCDITGLRGSGKIVSEQRQVAPFVNIETGGAFRMEWNSGPPSAEVTVDDNLQQYVEVKVSENVLHLRTTRELRPSHSLKVTLTSPSLEAADLNGASHLIVHRLTSSKFYLESSGATRVTIDGSVEDMIANMTGASRLDAAGLQTKRAEVSVTGAGKAGVTVSDQLKVSITGAGKVEYGGHPAKIEREITGAGSIKQRD